MEWFKAWHNEVLRGSLVTEDDSTQLIWHKLTALVSDTKGRNGRLEFGKNKPMSREFIIESISTTTEKFDNAICVFLKDVDYDGVPRITIDDSGTIILNKWDYEQHNNVKKPKREPMPEKQKQALINREVNKNPDVYRKALAENWHDNIITNDNKIY